MKPTDCAGCSSIHVTKGEAPEAGPAVSVPAENLPLVTLISEALSIETILAV